MSEQQAGHQPEALAPPGELSGDLRPPYVAAAIAAGAVLLLYVITLSRTTAFWDTSEYIATAHIMGVPHQPGNPLFVLLARAWSVLLSVTGLSVAVRVNLFSAVMSATAHGLWFLVVHHILRYFSEDQRFRIIGAATAVLVSATAFTVWNQSNVNEKVYTVSLLTIALLTWLAVRWQENLGKGKDDHLLILMVFILALSVGNHLMAFLVAPAIGLFVVYIYPKALLNWRLYLGALGATVLGISVYLVLPIRAGLGPIINEAAPTCPDIPSAIGAIATYGNSGCVALSDALQRNQYLKPPLLPRQAPLASQFVNYLQYFDWQWARSMDGVNTVFASLRLPFTMLFTGLGVWGAIEHARRDRASFLFMLTLFATVSAALVYYLNFKYGYTLQSPVQDRGLHEVRERDYFFIVSFSVWGLWVGMGIVTLWREAALEMKTTLARASPILGLALIPLVLNWGWASRANDYSARDWAYNLLMSVEPYAVLFTNGDNDTFPLWYLQEVEGIRQDVTVIVGSYLQTDWYATQLKQLTTPCAPDQDPYEDPTLILCQRPYTASNTGAAYVNDPQDAEGKIAIVVDEPIRAPTSSILPLTDEQIAQVALSYAPVEEELSLQLSNVIATIPAGRYLQPWQQFALNILNESLDQRPIYFASSGNNAAELGLQGYLIREGLAFRVNNGPPSEEGAGVVALAESPLTAVTGRWLELERTRLLLEEVFVHRTGLPDEWDHWPDLATVGIPTYYGWGYLALAQAAVQDSDQAALDRYRERAEAWSSLGL